LNRVVKRQTGASATQAMKSALDVIHDLLLFGLRNCWRCCDVP
jgi:hypothetical protein